MSGSTSMDPTVARSSVSNLFIAVLGHQAGADGFAGEDDNLDYWTSQLEGGTSLSAIRTSFADCSEAQTALGSAYQSVFGQTMGPATLKAAQTYLVNGGSLQQLEALWSSAQPQLSAEVENLYGAAMSASPLDAAVALVTGGSSIASAEAGWATQAKADVSNLFKSVLGQTAASDGYAGESDGLSTWTTDAQQGMSIADIQSQLAYGSEAQGDLATAYQGTFGQAIGTATLNASQQQLANGATLQQLKSLWSTVQPLVGSSYQAALGQAANAAQLDLGVSQATAQVKNSGTITLTWDLANGTSQSYVYTLSNPASPIVQTWSGQSATGTLVSTTGGTGATGSASGSMPGLTVTSVSQVNGQLVLVGTKSTGGAATLRESIDGGSVSTLWDNMPDGTFNFSSWFNVNLANGPHTIVLSFAGSSQTLTINFTVGATTSGTSGSTGSSSSTGSSGTSSTSGTSTTTAASGAGSMTGLTVTSVSQVNGQLALVGTKSTGGAATLRESVDGGSVSTLWDNMPDGPFNFSSWFNVNLASGPHTIVLSFAGSSQTLTINFTVGATAPPPPSMDPTAARSSVSNLFTTVLGYRAGADGFAGENDNLDSWTSQLEGGTSLSSIRTSLANSAEAQAVLGTAYQSVFGQTIGPATLAAAQSYLANGGSLQQLEALWFSAQPQLTAEADNLYGAAMSDSPLDAAVALVTGGSSITAAEASWATQAKTDVSNLFESVLGQTAASDGFAGESDGLSGWTGQAEAGTGLAEIQSIFAYSTEAQGDLSTFYQSIFGQAIGPATLLAAQQQLASGATLQQIEALWSAVQPLVASSYTSFTGQPATAALLDVGVAQATAQLSENISSVTLTWDASGGSSQSYSFDLASKQAGFIALWSAPGATGILLSTTVNNADGSSTVESYGADGSLTSSKTWSGANVTASLESQTTYNSDGSATTITYDWNNQQTWTTSTVSDSASNLPVTQVLANRDGSTTTWTYDQNGVATESVTRQTDGSYTDTLVAPTTAGEAWQKSIYNSSGKETESIIENTDGSWTDDKYWLVPGQAASELEESDLNNADGSQTDTVYNRAQSGSWTSYVLTKNSAGVNQTQDISYNDASTADWVFDGDGKASQATQTAASGSYKITYFNNTLTDPTQFDWQQYSYTASGIMTDQIVHNANTTWVEYKYYYTPATATSAPSDFLLEKDAHNADGTETETVNGLPSDSYNFYTLQVNAKGQDVTQTFDNKNGANSTINYANGQATSEQILQPNGTYSNTNFNGANGVEVTNYTPLGVEISTITYHGASSVQDLTDSSGVYEEDSFSGTNNVVRTLYSTATHPESYQARTEYWTGSTLNEAVELTSDGVKKDTVYKSDGSYVTTFTDTLNTQDWSIEVQDYNSLHQETEIDDTFHDGSRLNTTYDPNTTQATEIATYNADGSWTEEQISASGNPYGHHTTTLAHNAANVVVEAAYTDYNGDVQVQKFSDSGAKESVVIWYAGVSSGHQKGDTSTEEFYNSGGVESTRMDYATGAVSVTSFYDNGTKNSDGTVSNGSLESQVTTNADHSGTAFGFALPAHPGPGVTGAKMSEVDQQSDGSKVVKGWDTTGTQPWINYVVTYNADGSVYDSQFLLKDSVQDQSGNWVPTTTLFDSLKPTDKATLLMTAAELIEENEAQPANAKQDVQQRVTIPDGENYLVTVLANGQVFYKHEHGSYFEQIFNDVETVVTVIVDIVAAFYQQYWVIAATSAINGVTQLAEGNYLSGVLDLVAAVAAVGIAEAGPAVNGVLPAAAGPYQDVLAGIGVGEALDGVIVGAENGNVLTAVSGAIAAAGAGVAGFAGLGVDATVGIEVGEAVLGSAEAAANGQIAGAFAAAASAVGAALTAPSSNSTTAQSPANDAAVYGGLSQQVASSSHNGVMTSANSGAVYIGTTAKTNVAVTSDGNGQTSFTVTPNSASPGSSAFGQNLWTFAPLLFFIPGIGQELAVEEAGVAGIRLVPAVAKSLEEELIALESRTSGLGGGESDIAASVEDAAKSADTGTRFEGQTAEALQKSGVDLTAFQKPFGPNGSIGEIDIETKSTIVETTTSSGAKTPQVTKLINNSVMNPSGKPVILYAPNYGAAAEQAIVNAGGYVARNIGDLIMLINKFGG